MTIEQITQIQQIQAPLGCGSFDKCRDCQLKYTLLGPFSCETWQIINAAGPRKRLIQSLKEK